MPYFRYLHIESFRRQLDYFENQHGFLSKELFVESVRAGKALKSGTVLTFDDGFKDHYEYVYPELLERGIWGIFYVPMGVYDGLDVLDVHKIHLLLGHIEGTVALEALNNLIQEHELVHKDRLEYRQKTYETQNNSQAVESFKRMLNYFLDEDRRSAIINELLEQFGVHCSPDDFYLSRQQIREMSHGGMLLGNHGLKHLVYSKQSDKTVSDDITRSHALLDSIIGGYDISNFCYPYGIHSCTEQAKGVLTSLNCEFAFSVESRDVVSDDLMHNSLELPRYPCHLLRHGESRLG